MRERECSSLIEGQGHFEVQLVRIIVRSLGVRRWEYIWTQISLGMRWETDRTEFVGVGVSDMRFDCRRVRSTFDLL